MEAHPGLAFFGLGILLVSISSSHALPASHSLVTEIVVNLDTWSMLEPIWTIRNHWMKTYALAIPARSLWPQPRFSISHRAFV